MNDYVCEFLVLVTKIMSDEQPAITAGAKLLDELPDEVISEIYLAVALSDVPQLAATSSRFAATLRADDTIWHSHLWHCLAKALSTPSEAVAPSACTLLCRSWKTFLQACHPMPSMLVTDAANRQLVTKGATARFTGRLGRDRAVRTERGLPLRPFASLRQRRLPSSRAEVIAEVSDLVYFEISIAPSAVGVEGSDFYAAEPCVSIGVATVAFPLRGKQAGWDTHSVGYHGDDGELYHGSGMSQLSYGPRYGAGDTVGCGVCLVTHKIFFTHNGKYLGPAFAILTRGLPHADASCEDHLRAIGIDALYPVIGVDSHQRVHLNLGAEPFLFEPTAGPAAGLLARSLRTSPARWCFCHMPYGHPVLGADPADPYAESEESEEEEEDSEEGEESEEYELGEGESDGADGGAAGASTAGGLNSGVLSEALSEPEAISATYDY